MRERSEGRIVQAKYLSDLELLPGVSVENLDTARGSVRLVK